jgi:integrase
MPASAQTVALFLVDMAERYRPSTVAGLLAGIAFAHRVAGRPFDSDAFTAIVNGIRRTHRPAPRRAAAVTVADLRLIVDALPDTMQGARDRALLAVGFAGALRPSELVGLDVGQATHGGLGYVRIESEGALIVLGRSKGDQTGEGVSKWLPRGGEPCPVEALQFWLMRADIRSGPAFRRLRRGGGVAPKRLQKDSVADIVKQWVYRLALASAGSEEGARARASQASGHSLRVGFVTSALAAGVSSEDIADHVGWTSTALVFRYARGCDPLRDNPARLVLGV